MEQLSSVTLNGVILVNKIAYTCTPQCSLICGFILQDVLQTILQYNYVFADGTWLRFDKL